MHWYNNNRYLCWHMFWLIIIIVNDYEWISIKYLSYDINKHNNVWNKGEIFKIL